MHEWMNIEYFDFIEMNSKWTNEYINKWMKEWMHEGMN